MNSFIVILLLLHCLVLMCNAKMMSRKRRHLVFPEGASLSVAICMTAQTGLTPGEIFTEGINWGISYELPSEAESLRNFKKPLAETRRRSRRDLYVKVEKVLSSLGYNGRSCILRSLCEAAQKLKPRGDSLVDEILNILFRFPQQKLRNTEPEEHKIYHWASRFDGDVNCESVFPDCSISLIDLALGYYSVNEFFHNNK